MPKSAAGVLFIQESIVVFKIHSRSPILDSANRSGQEVHEDEQGQVEKDEEPEIQPVGVFRKPVHPGLRCLILVPPSSFERAPPFPDTVGTRRRLAHLHLRVVSLSWFFQSARTQNRKGSQMHKHGGEAVWLT